MRGKFRTYLPQGYFIRFGKKHGETNFKHYFCGRHNIKSATCPNCQKPLLRFVKFDLSDERLHLQNSSLGELSLFFCWTCQLSQGNFFYRCLDKGEIEILEYEKGDGWDDFPYENYPDWFPGSSVELVELSPLEQEILIGLNAERLSAWTTEQLKPELDEPSHQLGGEPYLVQKELRPLDCPQCRKAMLFFATVCDKALRNLSFVKNDYVQVIFYICSKCQIIGAIHEVD